MIDLRPTRSKLWPRRKEFEQLRRELAADLVVPLTGEEISVRALQRHYSEDEKHILVRRSWRSFMWWCCWQPGWRWRVFVPRKDGTLHELFARRVCPSCGRLDDWVGFP